MLTILSSPKPFVGDAIRNQANAIRSWLALGNDMEIILYGNSDGIEEAAETHGVRCVPDVGTNGLGTPLFGAIAAHAAAHGKHDLQAYVNCDILLNGEFVEAMRRIRFPRFLMIGQRVDLSEGVLWRDDAACWRDRINRLAESGGVRLHPPAGSDYFGFRRRLWEGLPEIAIGRGGYDGALIAFCLRSRVPIIDATRAVLAIHQFHDYAHLRGGEKEVFFGTEAQGNIASGNADSGLSLEDATWRFSNGRIVRSRSRGDWLRSAETHARLVLRNSVAADFINVARRLAYRAHLSRPRTETLADITSDLVFGN